MMWPGRFEALFDQRILGERVRYLWRQDGIVHTIRAEWIRGDKPWEMDAREATGVIRHEVIEKVTSDIESLIREKSGREAA